MTGHPAEKDAPLCEYGDCRRDGWVVLHFGPKKTPPLRVACHAHESKTDLSEFRDDRATTVTPPGVSAPTEPETDR